jgi:hypothetical protein
VLVRRGRDRGYLERGLGHRAERRVRSVLGCRDELGERASQYDRILIVGVTLRDDSARLAGLVGPNFVVDGTLGVGEYPDIRTGVLAQRDKAVLNSGPEGGGVQNRTGKYRHRDSFRL